MVTTEQNVSLDNLDRKILTHLMEDGRITWAQLASEGGLSAPSITERVRKLERQGVIEGYGARVNAETVGYGLLAFVAVGLTDPNHYAEMLRRAEVTPEIQEYHIVAGDYDYLLKIRCRDSKHLERLLREEVRSIAGVARTKSTIVMLTMKETCAVPLPDATSD
jgi:Lrp/AsnC family leucine-responsive transcriptional regulator